jgi:hypothetical protein
LRAANKDMTKRLRARICAFLEEMGSPPQLHGAASASFRSALGRSSGKAQTGEPLSGASQSRGRIDEKDVEIRMVASKESESYFEA